MSRENGDLPFCVFLDTQVYRAVSFDWTTNNFVSLRERVKRGSIELVTTSIVRQEVHKGIRALLNEFVQSLKKVMSRTGVVRSMNDDRVSAVESLTKEDFDYALLCAKADRFLSELNTTFLPVPASALQECFDMYFSGEAPFGSKHKKSEFPDAVNAITLAQYARKVGKKILVVSDDEDWNRTCADHPWLVHVRHLSEVLDKAIRAEWRSIDLFPDDELFAAIEAKDAEMRRSLELALVAASRVNLGDGSLDDLLIHNVCFYGFAATYIRDGDDALEVQGELFHTVDYTAYFSVSDDEMMSSIEQESHGSADLIAQLDLIVPLNNPKSIVINGVDYKDGLELELPLKF